MNSRALLLVDLQNDFCAGGALAVAEGDSTVDIANAMIAWCQSRGEPVVASQDWHPANHGSFASVQHAEPFTQGTLDGLPQTWWPDHCIQESDGAALHPLLNQSAIEQRFYKGENPAIDSYSAFFDNGHRQKTALDALSLGYTVNVITDGCRGVNLTPQASMLAFQEMAASGATLYTLDDWRETQP
ncbi:bifunctional nicotinamidase/pyrazinamidase [Cronobacter turicensis]